jgi:ankyrin repeat protein
MAQELEVGVHNEDDLLITRLACEGYWQDIKQVMLVSRVFRYDEQLWDAVKDEPGTGKGKRTRLIYAARMGDLERVRFLLARGARVENGCTFGIYTTHTGYTPLMGTSEEGHLEVVRVLCEKSADVNAACASDGQTALMLASENGHLMVVRELCEMGANLSATTSCPFGWTALMQASINGHLEVVRELCDRDADVNAATTDGDKSVLMFGCGSGSVNIVRELCTRGARVDARKRNGTTVIMDALESLANFGTDSETQQRIICELCEQGADVNATTVDGTTALMSACKYGEKEVIIELCERGADLNAAQTTDGKTVLMFAGHHGYDEVCIYLLEHGADKNALDFQGKTPYDYSLQRNNFNSCDEESVHFTRGLLYILK